MAKKTWIDKTSTLVINGKTISHGETFEEKDVNSDLLKKLIKEDKVADKVITEKQLQKEVEKVSKEQLTKLKEQHQTTVGELEVKHADEIEEMETKVTEAKEEVTAVTEKLATATKDLKTATKDLKEATDKIKKLEAK